VKSGESAHPAGRLYADQQSVNTMDSCQSTATSDDCKAKLQVRFPCKTRYIRIHGFSYLAFNIQVKVTRPHND